MFSAIVIGKTASGTEAHLRQIDEAQLSDGDVMIDVTCSTLNYKDALALTGRGPIVKSFPMIPGVDFAGTVLESQHPGHRPGDKVVLNGWGVGESHTGGLSQRARVKGEWLMPLPEAFTPAQAMAIGTAGYTAMLSILALERHGIGPDAGDIVVTGAAGGVGSTAVSLLAKLGYRVLASTGRPQEAEYLRDLGAAEIIDRQTLNAPGKPLLRERWIGAIDTVGSHTLANVCAATRYRGVVTACGLAQGMDLPATVAPFILRGVSLVGIESVRCPMPERLEAWRRLARDLDVRHLERMTTTIGLSDAIRTGGDLVAGTVRGRIVVDVDR